jgi:cellobiose phosphorylase
MYIVATQHLLGIRPTLAGLRVDPCLPPDGKGFRVTRRFRGATYRIEVVNRGAGRPARLWLDGRPLSGDVLPALPIGARAEVRAEV